jgi:predicted DNA-binding protein (MmcQ/YjbR family)
MLRRVSEICLALLEATEERNGSHVTFRVRKKVFAYFLDNHHGDGIVSVCTKTCLGENLDLVKADPSRFYLPAYIGARGWVGLRLDRPKVDWREVAELVRSSYDAVAPKKLRG